ncbi:MAG: LysR family transcriptional regulator [Pigmentiphaga sp.]|nr:LysR family transcriptional regulator [Pigmentiphaga sp.]
MAYRLERIHLIILREIERRGSLTAAAQALHLTQSALSHTIRKLEEAVGTPLWQRDGRGLRLTQAGEYLQGVAQRLLPQLEHAETRLRQYADGGRGGLRIGMECHPCHQWLLPLVAPYLAQWPSVDVDVRRRFQFGGIGALIGHEIDLLVTPDPLFERGLCFEPVFDYEQVLVVPATHRLAGQAWAEPAQLADETLLTYPVALDRLDIYTAFLLPAGVRPWRHQEVEDTDIMLELVAAGRGVAALPRWLVEREAQRQAIVPVRLGKAGVPKQIHLGYRAGDATLDYLRAFVELARAQA